ncbi:MAG: DNA-binding protein [Planctomycetes bacterium]|nr:DNA-binding protein [Planctomycetota bacterium]
MANTISIAGFFEPFSSLSHLLGALLFVALSIPLLRRGWGNSARTASLLVFCSGAVFLLIMSGLYHLLDPAGNARPVVRRLDHAAIFVLIACSFTPTHIIVFRGWRRWGILLIVWTYAIVAITLKMIYFAQVSPILGLAIYLTMGGIGLYPAIALWRRFGFVFILPIFWGGLAYALGGVLESLHWPILVPGIVQWHEVFHVAVLIGLGFHWAFTYQIADGRLQPIPS